MSVTSHNGVLFRYLKSKHKHNLLQMTHNKTTNKIKKKTSKIIKTKFSLQTNQQVQICGKNKENASGEIGG